MPLGQLKTNKSTDKTQSKQEIKQTIPIFSKVRIPTIILHIVTLHLGKNLYIHDKPDVGFCFLQQLNSTTIYKKKRKVF